MKRLIFAVAGVLALLATGCGRIWDVPAISVDQEEYIVSAEGGVMVIPVRSTGIDNFDVWYQYQHDEWETDENGDMYPKEGWCKLIRIINEYDATRDLPEWTSGIEVEIAPNNSDIERRCVITVWSFTKSAEITIIQAKKM